MIRKLLLGTVAGLTLLGAASAQVNVVPQVPTLRGASQQLCVNFNSVSISSGVLNGQIT